MKPLAALAALALFLLPGTADACITAHALRALIHSALPNPLPRGMIVAEVSFASPDFHALYGRGLAARVTRVIQGPVFGDMLIVRWINPSSCDAPFDNGMSGYIIAVDRGRGAAGLVVEPFPAIRGNGYRMPDGFTPPPEWMRDPSGR